MFKDWKVLLLLSSVLLLAACDDDDDNKKNGGMNGGNGQTGFGALVAQVFDQNPNDEPIAVNDLEIVDDGAEFGEQLGNP